MLFLEFFLKFEHSGHGMSISFWGSPSPFLMLSSPRGQLPSVTTQRYYSVIDDNLCAVLFIPMTCSRERALKRSFNLRELLRGQEVVATAR